VLQLPYVCAPYNLPYFFPCSSHSLFYLHILVYTWGFDGFEYQLMVRFGLPSCVFIIIIIIIIIIIVTTAATVTTTT
jgi:hypothetical protein